MLRLHVLDWLQAPQNWGPHRPQNVETSQLSRGFPLRKGQELGVLGGYPHVSGGLLFKPSYWAGNWVQSFFYVKKTQRPRSPMGMGAGMALMMGPGVRTVGGRFYWSLLFFYENGKVEDVDRFCLPRRLIRFGTDEAMCSDPEHGLIFGHVVPFLGADLKCEWWALRLPSFRENCSGIQHQGQGEVGHGRAEDPWPQLGIAASCFFSMHYPPQIQRLERRGHGF